MTTFRTPRTKSIWGKRDSLPNPSFLTDGDNIVRLRSWCDAIQGNIAQADAKAATLLGWSGTAWAVLAGLFGTGQPTWSGLGLVSAGLGILGLVLLGACVVVLVLAVRPNTATGKPAYGSFLEVGQLSVAEIVHMVTPDIWDAAPAALRVARLARIASRKHARVRTATSLLLASMLPLSLAAVLGALS